MEKLYDMKEEPEKVILVAVSDGDEAKVNESLDELEELVSTAGAITVGRMTQNRERIHPGTYIGKGKIEELKMYIESMEATGIVCDDELSPAQLKNLEQLLDTKVMDRTLIILDILRLTVKAIPTPWLFCLNDTPINFSSISLAVWGCSSK